MKFLNLKIMGLIAFSLYISVALTACNESKNIDSEDSNEMAASLFQERNITKFRLGTTKQVALTFDDGPTHKVTNALLDVLRKYNIKATFFMLGQNVKGLERTVMKARSDGHIIANHSYSHASLSRNVYSRDTGALLHEVRDSHYMLAPYMNPSHRMYFRAPYGAWTKSHAAELNYYRDLKNYIGPIFWNIGGAIIPEGRRPYTAKAIQAAADWDCWNSQPSKNIYSIDVDVCAAGYLKDILSKKGGVVLMHDVDMRTVQMVSILIPTLLGRGYSFVTLDEVSALNQYE